MSRHVLIIDDEPDTGEILSLCLGRQNYTVDFVTTGADALALIQQKKIDVVLLDVKMPDMDGFTVLKQLKAIAPKIPVIMLSGHADMEDIASAMELGAFFYQIKPADVSVLSNKIEDACRQADFSSQT